MKKDVLVTLADKHYLDQAKQLFSSVYWNAGWDGDYLLLAHEVPESKLKWFRKKGIIVKNCESLYAEKKMGGFPIVTTSKFYLFKREFKNWRTVIYIDADSLVRGSLDALRGIQGFNAVKDLRNIVDDDIVSFYDIQDRNLNKEETNILISKVYDSFEVWQRSFCSGFFAFSTDIISKHSYRDLKTLHDIFHSLNRLGEQLTLNLFLLGKWKPVSRAYNIIVNGNWTPFSRTIHSANRLGGIILHFGGPEKPWLDRKHPYYTEWNQNFKNAEGIDLTKKQRVPHLSKLFFFRVSFLLYLKRLFAPLTLKGFSSTYFGQQKGYLYQRFRYLLRKYFPRILYVRRRLLDRYQNIN